MGGKEIQGKGLLTASTLMLASAPTSKAEIEQRILHPSGNGQEEGSSGCFPQSQLRGIYLLLGLAISPVL